MNADDAVFTDDDTNFGQNQTDNIQEQLARRITDLLCQNYSWIRFVAITGVIFSIIYFGYTVLLNPLNIFGLITSVIYFVASYNLVLAFRAIRRSYECYSINIARESLVHIGRYFMLITIATLCSILF